MTRDIKRDTMSESNESEKSENQTSEFSEEELEKAATELADNMGYYLSFRIGLPDEYLEGDEARAQVSAKVLEVLEKLSMDYKGMTLDYDFGYSMRKRIPIELIG
jgi:hypothetical protein